MYINLQTYRLTEFWEAC